MPRQETIKIQIVVSFCRYYDGSFGGLLLELFISVGILTPVGAGFISSVLSEANDLCYYRFNNR